MKNAEVIRSMTDDQLYDFLSCWELGDIDYAITFCDLCKDGGNERNLDCDGCRKHWLDADADGYIGLNGWLRHNGYEPKVGDTEETR